MDNYDELIIKNEEEYNDKGRQQKAIIRLSESVSEDRKYSDFVFQGQN